jgi:hypothetical protein
MPRKQVNKMPSFEVTHEVEFEAYCESCNAGICSNITTRKSRFRDLDQIVIEPCEDCINKAKKEGLEEAEAEYEAKIEKLEAEIEAMKAGE